MSAVSRAALLLSGCLALAGCASIVDGTLEASGEVLITSSPGQAQVWLRNRYLCETPCHVAKSELPGREKFSVRFPSGSEVDVGPDVSFNPNIIGNVIFGGGIGLLLDTASGRLVRRGDRIHVAEPTVKVHSEPAPS
jgi:hypothetical protein